MDYAASELRHLLVGEVLDGEARLLTPLAESLGRRLSELDAGAGAR